MTSKRFVCHHLKRRRIKEENMCAPGVHDEANCRTGSSIRLANLETMVCELLRANQILREELAHLRGKTVASGMWGQAVNSDPDLRFSVS